MNQVHHARELIDEHRASVGDPEVTDADMLEINQELQTTIDQTRTSLERIGEYILKVRNQTRNNHTSSLSSFDPIRVARDALSMLEHQAQSARVRLQLEVSHELTLSVRGEAGRLTQVLSNLVVNAIHACEARRDPAGSTVTVRFDPVDGLLQVQVEDNGSGIAETVLPRIFEPLFTTKDASKGTGLGLSIIRDIVRGHFGGEVDVSTKVGCGTTFTVSLPLVK
jgi:signal transduction histidine kinase